VTKLGSEYVEAVCEYDDAQRALEAAQSRFDSAKHAVLVASQKIEEGVSYDRRFGSRSV